MLLSNVSYISPQQTCQVSNLVQLYFNNRLHCVNVHCVSVFNIMCKSWIFNKQKSEPKWHSSSFTSHFFCNETWSNWCELVGNKILQHYEIQTSFTPVVLTRFGALRFSFFFLYLKRDLKGIHFNLDVKVTDAVRSWVLERPPEFFIDGMTKQLQCWEKCLAVNGE